MVQALRIDWPTLLGDIAWQLADAPTGAEERRPIPTAKLAVALGVARSTLMGWQDGSEPKHGDGEMLLGRWAALTGKPREFAPLERRSLSAHVR